MTGGIPLVPIGKRVGHNLPPTESSEVYALALRSGMWESRNDEEIIVYVSKAGEVSSTIDKEWRRKQVRANIQCQRNFRERDYIDKMKWGKE